MGNSRQVELTLDLVCVHGYIGFTRLVRAARRFRDEGYGEAELTFRPFQLVPEAQATGEPLLDFYRRTRGEKFAHEVASNTSLGAEDGLELNFGRAVFTNSFDAHRLLAQASAQGRGEVMAERLFRAYFTDGLNIADGATLARLATEAGVVFAADDGADALHAELGRVREQFGNDDVPAFRFAGGAVLGRDRSEVEFLAALRG